MQRVLNIVPPHVLYAILAAVALLSLLMAFQQVVRGAVQRGESIRIAASVEADAAWRCRQLDTRALRDACRGLAGADRQERPMNVHAPAPVAPGSPR